MLTPDRLEEANRATAHPKAQPALWHLEGLEVRKIAYERYARSPAIPERRAAVRPRALLLRDI